MTKPTVIIIMGSSHDMQHSRKIAETLNLFNIETKMHIASAHKTPEALLKIISTYEMDKIPKIYITVAGRSNALSGFVDGQVTAPVIACPPLSQEFSTVDIFSSLRMPSGICLAVVLDPGNAALMAVKILSLSDNNLNNKLVDYQNKLKTSIIDADKEIQQND